MKKIVLLSFAMSCLTLISCKKEKEEVVLTQDYRETPDEMIDSTATEASRIESNSNKNYTLSLNEYKIEDALKKVSENLYNDVKKDEVGFILSSTSDEVIVTPIDFSLDKNTIDESWVQNTSCNDTSCLADQLKLTIDDLSKKGKELKIKVLKNGAATTVFTKK